MAAKLNKRTNKVVSPHLSPEGIKKLEKAKRDSNACE
jgi:hypothetical protein